MTRTVPTSLLINRPCGSTEHRKIMNLNRYLILEEEHTLSSDEVQALNADISAKGLSDIPEKHRERVADYIVACLLYTSPSPRD